MASRKTETSENSRPAPLESPSLVGSEIIPASQLRPPLDSTTPALLWPTNLDPSSARGRALIMAATQVADIQLDGQGAADIVATHWLIYPDQILNEQTGEAEEVIWCCLFDKDGRFFKTTSVFAPGAFRAAGSLYKPHEWAQGIHFRITSRLTANKRIAHDIRVVLDAH